jgi:hypothetical protein
MHEQAKRQIDEHINRWADKQIEKGQVDEKTKGQYEQTDN